MGYTGNIVDVDAACTVNALFSPPPHPHYPAARLGHAHALCRHGAGESVVCLDSTADQANHRFAQRTITKTLSVWQRAQPAQGAIRLLAAPLSAIASATLDQQASSHPRAVLALTVSLAPTAQPRVREANAVC
jgi:hypothetical protein